MHEKIFSKPLTALNFATPEDRAKVFAALNYFASGKGRADRVARAMQAFATPGDFPASILPMIEKFAATPAYDEGWKEIFDFRDMTSTKRNGFTLRDVEDGLAFEKTPLGKKAKIYGFSGSETTVNYDTFMAGLGWPRQLMDDEDFWGMEDNARTFVNRYYEHQAAVHYALLEALSDSQNILWQAPDPSGLAATDTLYTANRDAQTLNKAAETIALKIKDKGYGLTAANTLYKVVTPIQIVGRLNKALGLMLQGFAGSPNQVSYKFKIVPTTMLTVTTKYYVAVPGLKAKGGERMRLTVFDKFDPESYSDIGVGVGRYGSAIGDQEQFQRCSIS
jgi:hypothetical protein